MVRIILIGIVSVSSISDCRGGRYFRPVMGFRGFNFQLKMGSTKCCGPIASIPTTCTRYSIVYGVD